MMIYTVTLNPSIDYIIHLDHLDIGGVNRISKDFKLPGGKGINVSRILNQLEISTTALGFTGGFTGRFITDWLDQEGIQTNFIEVNDDSRINVKLKAEKETEMNGDGPYIDAAQADLLLEQYDHFTADDLVVLSGSRPKSLGEHYYQEMIQKLTEKNVPFVIDTTGADLKAALPYKPLLVKPNHHELGDLFGVQLETVDDMIPYGKQLLEEGPQFVIISLAGDGALLFSQEGTYHGQAPKGKVKNSVGAGDSMVAGFVGVYSQTQNPLEAFKFSIACGSATAFSDDLAKRADIDALLSDIQIKKIDGVETYEDQ